MKDLAKIVDPLLNWYRAEKRDLPWRHDPTPYRVWVSEIMLQQTRVEAAKEYYIRFLSCLPTLEDLARCEEGTLLKLWEGLGYYSRVRNMQRAAKKIVDEFGGEFPSDEKALLSLSGIGAYTAGAIRSIAFRLPAPAVDGNVLRVLSRYTAEDEEISSPRVFQKFNSALEKVYPQKGEACSEFTQSLMELGALCCTPQSPSCERCPIKADCLAHEKNAVEKYPVLKEKKEKRKEKFFVFVIDMGGKISVQKRTDGVLKNMFGFPTAERKDGTEEEILHALEKLQVKNAKILKRKNATHVFTHIVWEMDCVFLSASETPFEKFTKAELKEKIALPTAFRKIL